MWSILYRLVLLLAWPGVYLRLRWRARVEPEYGRRVAERFGRVPAEVPPGCVWFHTVSAGETIAAAPLIAKLARQFAPLPFLVTTMTPTGSAEVIRRLGDQVHHCYLPYDFPWAVRRFYQRVQPRLLVLMETELWPNLLREGEARGVPALLVNARLSERSARGYRRLGVLTRDMLRRLRYIACQYPDHARRFVELGAPEARVLVHGSVKFDIALPADHGRRLVALRRAWALRMPVWIAGSTHPGEEEAVLQAHARLRNRYPDARLILVPRHPARADEVEALCRDRGFTVARQSRPSAADGDAAVIVGDVMGELQYLYGLAEVAFVGGSLSEIGGHNPIEPAACGIPVLMGPRVFNFEDVVKAFREAGCLRIVADAGALTEALEDWLVNPEKRRALGARAREVVTANAGAEARLHGLLEREIAAAAGADDARALCRAKPSD